MTDTVPEDHGRWDEPRNDDRGADVEVLVPGAVDGDRTGRSNEGLDRPSAGTGVATASGPPTENPHSAAFQRTYHARQDLLTDRSTTDVVAGPLVFDDDRELPGVVREGRDDEASTVVSLVRGVLAPSTDRDLSVRSEGGV